MIVKYNIQGKDSFVPKVRGKFLEWVANLGVHVRTNDPHQAERFSTKEKAKNAIKRYRSKKIFQ